MVGPALERSSELAFQCESVRKEFGQGSATQGVLEVSLSIAAGEFLTIVGGSGVGKTTFLRVLGGLTPASSGTVRRAGQPVHGCPDGVVMVFQDYGRSLLPWRTADGNMMLGLEKTDLSKVVRAARVEAALGKVGLLDSRHKYPWQLSGGMQQRLQIARALAVEPDVLLMDEPFGSLDAITKATLQDELLKLHEEGGKTIVFVTHDVEEAIYLGDRVVVLAGRPAQIVKDFEVALPRPRDQLHTRELSAFLELRQEVHSALGHH
jgi:NitT/TauT family transport system ATP-binding protein